MRPGHQATIGRAVVAWCLIFVLAACAGRVSVPRQEPPPKPTPVILAPVVITVEPKQAVVRIGAQTFPTDADGTVKRMYPVGSAYYVRATASGHWPSPVVLVSVTEKTLPPIYFVLRKKARE